MSNIIAFHFMTLQINMMLYVALDGRMPKNMLTNEMKSIRPIKMIV